MSVSGNTAVIGAYAKNGLQGAAYVFVCPSLGTNALLVGGAGGTSSVVLTYERRLDCHGQRFLPAHFSRECQRHRQRNGRVHL